MRERDTLHPLVKLAREEFVLDARDGLLFHRHDRVGHQGGGTAKAGTPVGNRQVSPERYRRVTMGGKEYNYARIVYAIHYGRWPEGHVRSRNGMRHDYRPENIEFDPRYVKRQRRRLSPWGRGIYKGKRNANFYVRIQRRYLGSFECWGRALKATRGEL